MAKSKISTKEVAKKLLSTVSSEEIRDNEDNQDKRKSILIKIDEVTKNKVSKYAKDNKKSMNDVISDAIEIYLRILNI